MELSNLLSPASAEDSKKNDKKPSLTIDAQPLQHQDSRSRHAVSSSPVTPMRRQTVSSLLNVDDRPDNYSRREHAYSLPGVLDNTSNERGSYPSMNYSRSSGQNTASSSPTVEHHSYLPTSSVRGTYYETSDIRSKSISNSPTMSKILLNSDQQPSPHSRVSASSPDHHQPSNVNMLLNRDDQPESKRESVSNSAGTSNNRQNSVASVNDLLSNNDTQKSPAPTKNFSTTDEHTNKIGSYPESSGHRNSSITSVNSLVNAEEISAPENPTSEKLERRHSSITSIQGLMNEEDSSASNPSLKFGKQADTKDRLNESHQDQDEKDEQPRQKTPEQQLEQQQRNQPQTPSTTTTKSEHSSSIRNLVNSDLSESTGIKVEEPTIKHQSISPNQSTLSYSHPSNYNADDIDNKNAYEDENQGDANELNNDEEDDDEEEDDDSNDDGSDEDEDQNKDLNKDDEDDSDEDDDDADMSLQEQLDSALIDKSTSVAESNNLTMLSRRSSMSDENAGPSSPSSSVSERHSQAKSENAESNPAESNGVPIWAQSYRKVHNLRPLIIMDNNSTSSNQHASNQNALPKSLSGIEPYEDITRKLCNWLYATLTQLEENKKYAEVEIKIGNIVSKKTNQRVALPVLSECVVSQEFASTETVFDSSILPKQFDTVNSMLRQFVGNEGNNSLTLISPRKTTDLTFDEPGTSHSIRLTFDSDNKEVERISKRKISHMAIFSPCDLLDYRISVSVELPQKPYDFDYEKAKPNSKREKLRTSYIHERFQADLTRVKTDGYKETCEVELEFNKSLLLEYHNKIGTDTTASLKFEEMIQCAVDNARMILRKLSQSDS